MTQQVRTTTQATTLEGGRPVGRCDGEAGVLGWHAVRPVALTAAVAAAAAWVAARLAGVEIVAGAGSGQQVGLPSVVVTTLVASYAGAGLLRGLQRRARHAERTWSVLALLVLVVSLAGPLGARTPSAVAVLAAMHLLVAAVVVTGLRRASGRLADRPTPVGTTPAPTGADSGRTA